MLSPKLHGVQVTEPPNFMRAVVADESDDYLPGCLDWMKLLQVTGEHPGYYLYPIVNV
jgi:hypothetical protein